MTAEDIISANPRFGFVEGKIGSMVGLKGVDPDAGHEVWVIWHGDRSFVAAGPWTDAQIFRATEMVLASAGRVRYPETAMVH